MSVPKNTDHLAIAPLGDLQWSGDDGPTAQSHLRRYIETCLDLDVMFLGMGDYTDFASPSNRAALRSAKIYDTAQEVIEKASMNLVEEVYELFLKPTHGRWIGLLEGHHFFEFGGETSDMMLAKMLKTRCLGTSAYVHLRRANVTLWAHHGSGGGQLPSAPLNKLYHTAAGLVGADVYLMGHTTKLSAVRLSRPFPRWDRPTADLSHHDVLLVNTGGFSRSNVPGSRRGNIVRGDYAEQGMMTPSPLCSPIVHIYPKRKHQEDRIRVEL